MTEKRLQRALRMILLAVLIAALVRLARCVCMDRSAVLDGSLQWQGRTYRQSYGYYREDEQLAVATDTGGGSWAVNSVEGDPRGEQFVVVRSFLDQYLYQNEAYTVPESGAVTAVFLDHRRCDAAEYAPLMSAIETAMATERAKAPIVCDLRSFESTEIALCYEGCAVAPKIDGWIGVIDGVWVMANAERDVRILDEASGQRELSCTPIDKTVVQTLQNSGFFDFE